MSLEISFTLYVALLFPNCWYFVAILEISSFPSTGVLFIRAPHVAAASIIPIYLDKSPL